jgi:uncharacterized SAM-binding protein YcdF (DUF218 family)
MLYIQPRILPIVRRIRKYLQVLLVVLGCILLLGILLSFTHIPYYRYHGLGTSNSIFKGNPDYLIVLSGGSMPSADGLLKCYYAAKAFHSDSGIKIIVALPPDTNSISNRTDDLMKQELVLRGVDSAAIEFVSEGYNTYTQCMSIKNKFTGDDLDTLVFKLITSPEHMYRSVGVFKKAGFSNIGGTSTFAKDFNAHSLKKKSQQGRAALNFRYNIWSYLQYEIIVLREYFAITYYKMRGWI